MKIAIVGAGIAGLSCAHELERLGIDVDIFEVKRLVGDVFPHVGALLQIVNRPIKDPLKFLKERYFIDIAPLNLVKHITMYAPNVSSDIHGTLGYFALRGQNPLSCDNLLAKKLKTKIKFNTIIDLEKLSKTYFAVVVATSRSDIPKEFGIWTTLLDVWIKGAFVIGSFDKEKLEMWLNTDYAKQGYGYLCPFDENTAALGLVVNDIKQSELENYWQKFWSKEKFEFKASEFFEINLTSGYVFPNRVENIYFAGNTGGFLEPLLGFGLFHAVVSGVTAARCIVEGKNYDIELKPYKEEIIQMLEFRKALNSCNNDDFDRLVKMLGLPGLNQLVYNTNIDVIKGSSSLLGLVSKAALNRFLT